MDELAKEWLHKVDNDLLNAENNLNSTRVPTDTVCFHCQQGVEKYLKGFLVSKQIEFPNIHNLLSLLELCKEADANFEMLRDYCLVLNDYAVEIRYPDDWFEPSIDDAKEAFATAKKVEDFIRERLR